MSGNVERVSGLSFEKSSVGVFNERNGKGNDDGRNNGPSMPRDEK